MSAAGADASTGAWGPVLLGLAGFAAGVGLAYVVTRPKSPAQIAHEMLVHEAAAARANGIRRRTR